LGFIGRKTEKNRQRRVYRQYDKHLQNRDISAEVFAMAQLPNRTRLNWQQLGSDLVHLHWISFLADYASFFGSIPDHVPIVWTLHDMNPFTGGCHYSDGCERFKSGCGNCPQIVAAEPDDVSFDSFQIKRRALANKNIHVVAPSEWLLALSKQSSIWPARTTFNVIKLGFDLNSFFPLDKQLARLKLGLTTDAVLIGFGAEDIRNRRKGFQHLINCLPQVKTSTPIECLVFGSGEIPDREGLPNMNQLGYVDSVQKQALIYSAADLVVVPSREDNQPQVGLEAMACGTPVIGFDAGGIPEYVRDGLTGWLVELGDEEQLAARISQLVDDADTRTSMSIRARAMMEAEFDIVTQADKYVSLYNDVCSSSNRKIA
jgi:glycosyltransferase involved in cell wall biosynthesis